MVSDPDGQLLLVRKSDSYVMAAVGEWDLARFKCTERAKWIMFPTVLSKQKHKSIISRILRMFIS